MFAADRSSATRSAFLSYDPEQAGVIAPHLVPPILRRAGLSVPHEILGRYKQNGKFQWLEFVSALQQEVDAFMRSLPPATATARGRMDARSIAFPGYSTRALPTLLCAPSPYTASPRRSTPAAALSFYEGSLGSGRLTLEPPPSPRSGGSGISSPRRPLSPPRTSMQGSANASELNSQRVFEQTLSPREVPSSPLHLHRSVQRAMSPRLGSARFPRKASPERQSKLGRILAVARGIEDQFESSDEFSQLSARAFPAGPPHRMAALTPNHGRGAGGPAAAELAAEATPLHKQPSFTPGGPGYVKITKRQQENFQALTTEAINSRFKSMKLAFRYVDVDNSGRVDKVEIIRALNMWNVPHDPQNVENLIMEIDDNGDGMVDYKEFVDALARDTVAPAAMIKQDNWKSMIEPHEAVEPGTKVWRNLADTETLHKVVTNLRRALHVKFPDIFTAFQRLDANHSGWVERKDLARLLKMLRVPHDERSLALLVHRCDSSGDGRIIYSEFEEALSGSSA